jgi:hypothetical protein
MSTQGVMHQPYVGYHVARPDLNQASANISSHVLTRLRSINHVDDMWVVILSQTWILAATPALDRTL